MAVEQSQSSATSRGQTPAPASGQAGTGAGGAPSSSAGGTKAALRGMDYASGAALVTPPPEGGGRGGGGAPLPPSVRAKMEASFGADFSDVRVHEGGAAAGIGAQAYAQGSDLHFAPGKYDPESESGQELLGHELTHVVQQRSGRVSMPQGKGASIQKDAGLETEADQAGARAASGRAAQIGGGGAASGASGVAPIQRKEDESAGAKDAGTHAHAEEARAMLRGDEEPRVAQLVAALRKNGMTRANLGAGPFHQVSLALHGGGAKLAEPYKTKVRSPTADVLKNDIATAFGPQSIANRYLQEVYTNGKASFALEVALLAGLGPDKAVPAELTRMMEAATPVEFSAVKGDPTIAKSVKEKMGPRWDTLDKYHAAAGAAPPVAPPGGQAAPVDRVPIIKARDAQFMAILGQKTGRTGSVDAEGLIAEIKAFLPQLKLDERAWLADIAQSDFGKAIAAKRGHFGKLTQKNGDLILDLLKTGHLGVVQGQVDVADDQKKAAENKEKANELAATMKHAHSGNEANTSTGASMQRAVGWRDGERAALRAQIEGMSDQQRLEYLDSKVIAQPDKGKLLDPAAGAAEKNRVFKDAFAVVARELKAANFEEKDIAVLQARFRLGSTAGGHYLALHALAKGSTVVFGSFADRALELMRGFDAGETAQLVQDKELLKTLWQRSNKEKWKANIEPLLGVKLGPDGAPIVDKLAAIEAAPLLGGAADKAKAEAFDLDPKHLAQLLNLAIHGFTTNKPKVFGLVQRVQRAADAWGSKTPEQRRMLAIDAGESANAHRNRVTGLIAADKLKWLETEMPKAYGGLTAGTAVTVDDRLTAAQGTVHSDKDQIVAAFEDLSGAELLKEWSDVDAFKASIITPMKALQADKRANAAAFSPAKQTELDGLERKQKTYIIGIRKDRYAYLNKNMSRTKVVETEKKLLAKLRAAAESDAEFRAELGGDVKNDAFAQELMTTVGTLSEHRVRASGYQNAGSSGESGAMREGRSQMVGAAREGNAAATDTTKSSEQQQAGRDSGAEAVKDKRDKYEQRAKSFDTMKAELEAKILLAIQVLAMITLTAATAGTGTLAAMGGEVAFKSIVIAMKSLSSVIVKHCLRGDAQSIKDTIVELSVAGAEIGGEYLKGIIDVGIAGLQGLFGSEPPSAGMPDGRSLFQQVGSEIMTYAGKASGNMAQEAGKGVTETLVADGTSGMDKDMSRKLGNLARVGAAGLVSETAKDKLGVLGKSGMKQVGGMQTPSLGVSSPSSVESLGDGAKWLGAQMGDGLAQGVNYAAQGGQIALDSDTVGFAALEYTANPVVDTISAAPYDQRGASSVDKGASASSVKVKLEGDYQAAQTGHASAKAKIVDVDTAEAATKKELTLDGPPVASAKAKLGEMASAKKVVTDLVEGVVKAAKGIEDEGATDASSEQVVRSAKALGAEAAKTATTVTTKYADTEKVVTDADTKASEALKTEWGALEPGNGVDALQLPDAPEVVKTQKGKLGGFAAKARVIEGAAGAYAKKADDAGLALDKKVGELQKADADRKKAEKAEADRKKADDAARAREAKLAASEARTLKAAAERQLKDKLDASAAGALKRSADRKTVDDAEAARVEAARVEAERVQAERDAALAALAPKKAELLLEHTTTQGVRALENAHTRAEMGNVKAVPNFTGSAMARDSRALVRKYQALAARYRAIDPASADAVELEHKAASLQSMLDKMTRLLKGGARAQKNRKLVRANAKKKSKTAKKGDDKARDEGSEGEDEG